MTDQPRDAAIAAALHEWLGDSNPTKRPAIGYMCERGAAAIAAALSTATPEPPLDALTARTAPVIDDYMPDATLAERQAWERAIRAALGTTQDEAEKPMRFDAEGTLLP